MAVDKLVDSTQLDTDLTAVANAIRTKGGTSASLAFPNGFVDAIDAIETGGGGGEEIDAFIMRTTSGDYINNTITSIGAGAFYACPITSFSSDSATSLAGEAFHGCNQLISVSLPNVTSGMWTNAFYGCSRLVGIVLPKFTGQFQNSTFYNCSSLQYVDFLGAPNLQVLNDQTFRSAVSFETLIIRSSNLITLRNISVFQNTPFASGGTGGTLYVPSALISSYQSATNWSTILGYANNSIQAIEGSQYENYYADGTPIT